jgi:hypothetical protein
MHAASARPFKIKFISDCGVQATVVMSNAPPSMQHMHQHPQFLAPPLPLRAASAAPLLPTSSSSAALSAPARGEAEPAEGIFAGARAGLPLSASETALFEQIMRSRRD